MSKCEFNESQKSIKTALFSQQLHIIYQLIRPNQIFILLTDEKKPAKAISTVFPSLLD